MSVAHRCGDSVGRCPAYSELFGCSRGRQTGFDEFLSGRNRFRVEWRSTRRSASFARRGDAVAGALGDEPGLEVRDGTEDVEHELAGGRGGIETLLEADQVDAAGVEAADRFEQLLERASQTVEPGDAQAVTGSGVVDELGEPGALRALSGPGGTTPPALTSS